MDYSVTHYCLVRNGEIDSENWVVNKLKKNRHFFLYLVFGFQDYTKL